MPSKNSRKKAVKKVAPAVETKRKKVAGKLDLGAEIDRYYKMRANRLAKEREIGEMKKAEQELSAQLIMQLGAHGLDRAAGRSASVSVNTKLCPRVESWPGAYEWLRDNDCLHFLQRRWNESAVREYWEGGGRIPGVQPEPVVTLHLAKLSK